MFSISIIFVRPLYVYHGYQSLHFHQTLTFTSNYDTLGYGIWHVERFQIRGPFEEVLNTKINELLITC
jgi:hypothetical protein